MAFSQKAAFQRLLLLGALAACVCVVLSGCSRDGTADDSDVPARTVPARFVDVAEAAGLHYRWTVPGNRPWTILQDVGNGCAFLDYNNDGNLDILLVGPRLALYQGYGQGHFTNVTHEVGLDRLHGHFLGCAVGDYNNDGYEDIYLSGYRTGLLLHNERGRDFQNVTQEAGIRPQPWGTSCAFADVDGDGYLDLYICNYVKFGPHTVPQQCGHTEYSSSCGPKSYQPERGAFYHNLAGHRFQDVTEAWQANRVSGKGLGVVVADFDGSGRPSLAIANDEMAGDLLKNVGGKFKNISQSVGTAYNGDGYPQSGMGTDWGDYDNDGRFDLFVATFQDEIKSLYHNEGSIFEDVGKEIGTAQAAFPFVTFGAKFFDFDNDGWLDLILANGDVRSNHPRHAHWSYRQPTLLLHNKGSKPVSFAAVYTPWTVDLQRPIVGRGLAVGDYDNDGRVDVLVVDSEGKPLLLHNQAPNAGHWLGVRLIGTQSNLDGYGAVLTAAAGGRSLMRQCQSDGSYLSASDARVHFGLGAARQVETLTIRWPSGHIDTVKNISADRYITLREGDGTIRSYP